MPARLAALASLLALTFAAPAAGQMFGDRQRVDCGLINQRQIVDSTIEIVCGMTAAEFADNMRLALSPLEADRQELFRRLDALLPDTARIQAAAMRGFFRTLGEAEVPPEHLQDRFAEIATRHLELLDELRRVRAGDAAVQALREAAAVALEADPPDHDQARAALDEARALVRARRQEAQREEAELVREQAEIEEARLRYAEAARLYEEAADLLPTTDVHGRWANLLRAAGRYTDHGRDFADNAALVRAIDVYEHASTLNQRATRPFEWAMTQNNLGDALATLGERESGIEHLEQAVAAYRDALSEWTRESIPMLWAVTQYNLGNALRALGQRESGNESLEQAVDAYRLALEEWSRDRHPLDWAMTQSDLGIALQLLGGRESGTERLAQAVVAYRNALQEHSRERVPSEWAATQYSLGNALATLGERESGTERLEEAVGAYRNALEKYTRERVPLIWATTRTQEAMAWMAIAERQEDAEAASEAAAALRDAWSVNRIVQPQYDGWFEATIAEADELAARLTAAKGAGK